MLLAHFSDPHFCGLINNWSRLRNNKQLLGAINWITKRGKIHNSIRVQDAILDLLEQKPDLVFITGDISQLALAGDYNNFSAMLTPLRNEGIPIIIQRGNHDMYSSTPQVVEAFTNLRRKSLTGLPKPENGIYQLPGVTIAEIDAAVPTTLKNCNGEINPAELQATEKTLQQTDPSAPRICCCHFPLRQEDGNPQPSHKSLHGSDMLLDMLHKYNFRLYLCGHIHEPFSIDLGNGLTQYCAGSASATGQLNYFTLENKSLTHTRSLPLQQ